MNNFRQASQLLIHQFPYLVKQAWGSLQSKPAFVSGIITTLGLTLGALLTVLTLAYVMLLKPLPYPQQEQLYTLEHQLIDKDGKVDGRAFTYPNLMHFYRTQQAFSLAALIYYDADVLISSPKHPTLSQAYVTPEWFNLLDARMALGRGFEQTEAVNQYHPVAVLSYDTWQKEFSLSPDILEQKVTFSGTSYRIIGVLSQDFQEPELLDTGMKSQVFLPWDFNSISEAERKKWGNDDDLLNVLAKLPAGKNPEQVGQALTGLINNNWQENVAGYAFFNGWGIKIKLHSLKTVILGGSEQSIYLLLAGLIALVLIAITNITNLFISRTAEQQHNLAIHAAIGASKSQLFAVLLIQTGLLMLMAMVLALVVATFGFALLQQTLNHVFPRVDELAINAFTLGSALLLSIGLALFFARVSAHMLNYRQLNTCLHTSGKGNGVQVPGKIRNALIIIQITIVTSLVLACLVLFKKSLDTINQDGGFDTDNITFMVLALPSTDKEAERANQLQAVRRQLLALPQVEAVSQALAPMAFTTRALTANISNERYSVKAKDIDHKYFSLINQPLIEGNDFSPADIKDDNDVIIVNDVFARQLAPGASALGLTLNGNAIIGVVKGIRLPGKNNIPPRFYYPTSQGRNMMLIKHLPGQALTREQLVSVLGQVNSRFKLFSLSTLNERRQSRLFSQYTTAVTSGALSLLTLLLAAIGLYGIISFGTQMRRLEIGTRLAVGAKRRNIIWLIFKDNAVSVILGILTGLIGLLLLVLAFSESLTPYINWQLLPLLVATFGLITVISCCACYLPLRRYLNQAVALSLKTSP
ncbi:ABC transporter permease [Thalassomonas sp. RHCl1]|uniref:ABC transporter permease n=1 Tax=Thalassomonas sp. RHCl1 TaxID=2995320 RepID=UPI00248C32D8|nr:ABC transporter permease [Thalassomonas sp. RHCl1]